jgi:hypothetical protein
MSDERPEITRLLTEWRSKTEIKDFGDLGACFSHDGYTEQGFRPLRYSEKKLLELCADELDAALRASQPENVLSAPMAAGLLLKLKEECETQHARADKAEAALAALRASQEGRAEPSIGEEHRLLKIAERVAVGIETLVNYQPFVDIGSFEVERVIMSGLREASAPSEGVPDDKKMLSRAEENKLSVNSSSPPQEPTGDSSPLAPERLAAIRERVANATHGPWQVIADPYEPAEKHGALAGKIAQRRVFTVWNHPQLQGPAPVVNGYITIAKVCGQQPHHGVSISAEDAEFIAHAREDVPYLLDLLATLGVDGGASGDASEESDPANHQNEPDKIAPSQVSEPAGDPAPEQP